MVIAARNRGRVAAGAVVLAWLSLRHRPDDLEVLSDNGMFGNNYPDSLWQVPPVQLVSRARAAFERLWTGRRSDAG